jgi:hypothetical protein
MPTRLTIPSECDRQLLAGSATSLAAEHREAIIELLNRPWESLHGRSGTKDGSHGDQAQRFRKSFCS